MDRNLWNYEPKLIFTLLNWFAQVFYHSNEWLTNTGSLCPNIPGLFIRKGDESQRTHQGKTTW
jgi:hypothetical protein